MFINRCVTMTHHLAGCAFESRPAIITKGRPYVMTILTPKQRLLKINSLIEGEVFENSKLVYAFVSDLRSNREIDECLDYTQTLLNSENEKYRIYYRLWHVSLLYLRGYFEKAKQEFFSLPQNDIPDPVKSFYLKTLGFDELYNDFIIEETEHFIFHIHPKRYENKDDIRYRIERRELGYELVGKYFFGLTLERKIRYFLWDDAEMKNYFHISRALTPYGLIQEGEMSNSRDWHESTHIYNYLYGEENFSSFISEGIAVFNDGRKGSNRLSYAQGAYKKLGISPDIMTWWQDRNVFRGTDSWSTYTTAGYFVLKLHRMYGKEKLLQLAKYQTYEDACRIYGEEELMAVIRETENEIISLPPEN